MERLRKLNRKLKNSLLFEYNSVIICSVYGVWRSLVARTAGGREVAGSNPVAPIFFRTSKACIFKVLAFFVSKTVKNFEDI